MTTFPIRTLLCSPWAGEVQRNKHYAQDCMRDSLARGEAPFASHLLFTQVLLDSIPEERALGLLCEEAWLHSATQVVFYIDFGYSPGMLATQRNRFIIQANIPMLERKLGDPWSR